MKTRDLSQLAGTRFEREIRLDVRELNLQARTIPASLSSESPVSRWFGTETLDHTADAINLERAQDGLPLLWQHNHDQPIGVVENVRLKDGKLRGVLRFSTNPKATEVFEDVSGGFLRNVSIGYSVDRWEESTNSDNIRVTGWTLLEASVVSVPADASVGINRSLPGVKSMTDESKPADVGTDSAPVADISKLKRDHLIAKKAGAAEAIKSERQRIRGIHDIFDLAAVPRNDFYFGLRSRAIDEGWTIPITHRVVLEAMSGEAEPVLDYSQLSDTRSVATHEGRLPPVVIPAKPGNHARGLGSAQITHDELDKFVTGAVEGMLVRGNLVNDKEVVRRAREGGMVGRSLVRLAGDYLQLAGENTRNLDDEGVANRAISTRAQGMTSSDFTSLLQNVANKALLTGFEESPETWNIWTRRGTLPDFKQATRINMSGFTGLAEVAEDGEITYGKFTDRKETIQLVSYAKKYRMSRQLIINDDLGGLTQIPRAMGRAANRKIGDVVYALLNGTGPTLAQDSTALWDTSTHKNYVAAATAPTVDTLTTAVTAMAKQTDPNTGAVLNIYPRYLVVPVALQTKARELMKATYNPAGTAGTLPPNPFSGSFEVVSDARLDGQTYGAYAWYLFGDPNIYDTFEVAFLNGVDQPYMRENQAWDSQSVEYVVGIDFGVSALDFRAVHKYRGN